MGDAFELSIFLDDEEYRAHVMSMQDKTAPDRTMIATQPEISWQSRRVLLDFLVEVHGIFDLLPETLFLTMNILDRYCSRTIVNADNFQLTGCVSLLIAAKYGEQRESIPAVWELSKLCCWSYSRSMFVSMEMAILHRLDWMLGSPTVPLFLRAALLPCGIESRIGLLAQYISEVALYHELLVSVAPSIIAGSSIHAARLLLHTADPPTTGWNLTYNAAIVARMLLCLEEPSPIIRCKHSVAESWLVPAVLDYFVRLYNGERPGQVSHRVD